MQLVERPWGVTVHGMATVKAKPDLARIRFRVARRERTPSQAFAAVTEAVGAVHQVLRQHGVPDEAIEQAQLSLQSTQEYETRVDASRCESPFVITYADLDDVQPLVVDVVAAGAGQIDGLDFDVSGKAELSAEARRQAVGAARRKAELYTEAAGVRLGEVLHIEDVVPDWGGRGGIEFAAAASSSSGEVLVPGNIIIPAEVIIGFAIER
jgi:uncharacterized protein